jgi:two-component system sensor histidine kinase PilS (NtrC family)
MAATATAPLGADEDRRRRVTYVMLFRVAVVTVLLGANIVSELAAPVDQTQALTTRGFVLLGLIAGTYALTIVFALWLQRARRVGPLAWAQLATDLATETTLVALTGGADSPFGFLFVLIIVAASFVVGARALWVAAAAIALHALVLALSPSATGGAIALLRQLAYNAVSFAAAGLLAARLAGEATRASEREASTGMQLRDLATVHADVIRCLTSGLVTVTTDGVVLTMNQAAGEILGIAPGRALGRSIDEVMPGLRALTLDIDDRARVRRGEIDHRRFDDGRAETLGVSVSPLVDAAGQRLGRIVNFQDLSELRRMEREVVRNERLAAIGRLAAGVAHEIRNPLAAISGSVELLAQGLPSDDRTSKELMGIVLTEVARLDGLIAELLDFARPRAPQPQRVDLSAAIVELARVLSNDRATLGERALEVSAPEPVYTEVDPAQLRQIVWNLVRNAAQASPDGAPVSLRVAADGGWAQIEVRDRGPGIPPEHRARLFEPFFSTKSGGTGLGLATVHRIIEAHHGRIELVDAQPGPGTQVVVRLPLPQA